MKGFIFTVISGIVIAIFTFYLNHDKPTIVYTTSENIAAFNETNIDPHSNIQQITVKNIGKSAAKDIQVKINGTINDSAVIKDSAADKIELHKEGFELIYEELPPDGSFKLVIKSTLSTLNDNVLTVKSSNGLAKNGLEDNNSIMDGLFYLFIIFYSLLSIYSLREIYVNMKVRRYSLNTYESPSFINNKKPFYFTEREWKELLNRFIQEKIRSDISVTTKSLKDLNSYVILINEKPEFFTIEEWETIKKKAKEIILLNIEIAFSRITFNDDTLNNILLSYCDSTTPLPETFIDEISIKISQSYTQHKMNKYYYNTNVVNKALEEKRPNYVKISDWEQYITYLKNLQFVFILNEIYESFNQPLAIFEKYKENIKENKDKIEKLAYNIEFYRFISNTFKDFSFYSQFELPNKPEWMTDIQYNELKKIIITLQSTRVKEEEIKKIFEIISKALSKLQLPESKPTFVSDYNWEILKDYTQSAEKVKSIQDELTEKERLLNDKESLLTNEKQDLNTLKEKIETQLEIINNLLIDPSSIYRIEEYSNPFALGNMENLKMLADLLTKHKSE